MHNALRPPNGHTQWNKTATSFKYCDIPVDVIKWQMHNAEPPTKCHTQSTKSAAFFDYAHHSTGHQAL